MIFDTHFHLQPDDDLNGMMSRAAEVGVGAMLVAGAAVDKLARVLDKVAATWQDERPTGPARCYAAAGVHPHEAEAYEDNPELYRDYLALPYVRAVGEIGLDYFYDHAPRERQRQVFGEFLDLSRETGLPAIVHCREAYEDTYALLKERLAGAPFVVHCFSGTPDWAERFLAIGGSLSYTGLITFNKAENVRESLRVTPLDKVFFETDSPYLAPVPHRGKTNEPAYVVHVVQRAAMEFGISEEEMIAISTRNGCAFFDVPA